MKVTAKTKLCMVIGDPISHSLSPEMHNAGYKALGIDGEFVYVAGHVKSEDLEAFVTSIRVLGIRGVSVTIPHKEAVIPFLDKVDETARKIGAVNTIVNDDGILTGFNTDWIGVVKPLEQLISLKDKSVAIVGAGGAARGAIYGLQLRGAKVTVFNRTFEKATVLAKEFGVKADLLDNIANVKKMDVILNVSSVGMHPQEGTSLVPKEYISSRHVVFDAIYKPRETKLLQDAKKQGAKIVHGLDMLLYQGAEQFQMYTGCEAPVEVMQEVLKKHSK